MRCVALSFASLVFSLVSMGPMDALAATMERAREPGPAVPEGAAPTPAPASAPSGDERRIYTLANEERARHGLPPLVWDERLAEVARAHSADMRGRGRLDHASSGARATPIERAQRAGLHPGLLLENIAKAYSPDQANLALMLSPGHRRNILDPEVRKLGVGVAVRELPDGERELWVTQDFARELPPLTAATPGRARDRVLDWYRQTIGGGGWLGEDAQLSQIAQSLAELFAAGRPLGAVPTMVSSTGLSYVREHRELQVIVVRTADPDHLGQLPAPIGRAESRYGVGVALEPEGRMRDRSACVVLILDSR